MRSFENEHPSNIPPADFRPRQEEQERVLGQFIEEWKNLKQKHSRIDSVKSYRDLDAKVRGLRERINRVLKKRSFVSRPDEGVFGQMKSLISEIRDLEQTLFEHRPAA